MPERRRQRQSNFVKPINRWSWTIGFLLLALVGVASLVGMHLFKAQYRRLDWLPSPLHASLQSNYSAELRSWLVPAVSVALIQDVLRDDLANADQYPSRLATLQSELQIAVPTITPFGSLGGSTPTATLIPSLENLSTATLGPTPIQSPTATRLPSATPTLTTSPTAPPPTRTPPRSSSTQTDRPDDPPGATPTQHSNPTHPPPSHTPEQATQQPPPPAPSDTPLPPPPPTEPPPTEPPPAPSHTPLPPPPPTEPPYPPPPYP